MLRRVDTSKPAAPPGVGGFAIVRRDLDERACVISVDGELDLSTAPRLKWMLVDALEGGSCQVVIDLSNVTFMDSSGINALLRAHKKVAAYGGWIRMSAMSDHVLQAADITGLPHVLPYFPGLDDALRP